MRIFMFSVIQLFFANLCQIPEWQSVLQGKCSCLKNIYKNFPQEIQSLIVTNLSSTINGRSIQDCVTIDNSINLSAINNSANKMLNYAASVAQDKIRKITLSIPVSVFGISAITNSNIDSQFINNEITAIVQLIKAVDYLGEYNINLITLVHANYNDTCKLNLDSFPSTPESKDMILKYNAAQNSLISNYSSFIHQTFKSVLVNKNGIENSIDENLESCQKTNSNYLNANVCLLAFMFKVSEGTYLQYKAALESNFSDLNKAYKTAYDSYNSLLDLQSTNSIDINTVEKRIDSSDNAYSENTYTGTNNLNYNSVTSKTSALTLDNSVAVVVTYNTTNPNPSISSSIQTYDQLASQIVNPTNDFEDQPPIIESSSEVVSSSSGPLLECPDPDQEAKVQKNLAEINGYMVMFGSKLPAGLDVKTLIQSFLDTMRSNDCADVDGLYNQKKSELMKQFGMRLLRSTSLMEREDTLFLFKNIQFIYYGLCKGRIHDEFGTILNYLIEQVYINSEFSAIHKEIIYRFLSHQSLTVANPMSVLQYLTDTPSFDYFLNEINSNFNFSSKIYWIIEKGGIRTNKLDSTLSKSDMSKLPDSVKMFILNMFNRIKVILVIEDSKLGMLVRYDSNSNLNFDLFQTIIKNYCDCISSSINCICNDYQADLFIVNETSYTCNIFNEISNHINEDCQAYTSPIIPNMEVAKFINLKCWRTNISPSITSKYNYTLLSTGVTPTSIIIGKNSLNRPATTEEMIGVNCFYQLAKKRKYAISNPTKSQFSRRFSINIVVLLLMFLL